MSDFDRVICQYDGFKSYSGNPPKNEVEYNELFSDWDDKPKWVDVQAQLTSTAYKNQRSAEYPSIADQLDTLYHGGYDAWKAQVKEIKDKYPKA